MLPVQIQEPMIRAIRSRHRMKPSRPFANHVDFLVLLARVLGQGESQSEMHGHNDYRLPVLVSFV